MVSTGRSAPSDLPPPVGLGPIPVRERRLLCPRCPFALPCTPVLRVHPVCRRPGRLVPSQGEAPRRANDLTEPASGSGSARVGIGGDGSGPRHPRPTAQIPRPGELDVPPRAGAARRGARGRAGGPPAARPRLRGALDFCRGEIGSATQPETRPIRSPHRWRVGAALPASAVSREGQRRLGRQSSTMRVANREWEALCCSDLPIATCRQLDVGQTSWHSGWPLPS